MSVVIKGSSNVNLDFTTGGRITGDFSSTPASRVAFQTSTVNGNTNLEVIPNGTSTTVAINLESDPALTNGTFLQLGLNGGTDARFTSAIRGTGTYLPMTFFTGGSERVRVDTAGNVGIGTSSPATYSSRLVSVSQAGGAAQSLDAPSGTNTSINWYNNGTAKWTTQVLTTGEFRWFDFTASATRLTLDSSGNLGLGVTPPASGARALYIAGADGGYTALTLGASGGNYGRIGYGFAITNSSSVYNYRANDTASMLGFSSGGFQFYTAPSGTAGNAITFTQAMTLSNDGTRSTLDLNGQSQTLLALSTAGTRRGYLYFASNDIVLMNEGSTGVLTFGTNAAERARIDSSGNVGIGTTSPATRLQVNAAAPAIRIQETTTGGDKRLELGVTSGGLAYIGANQSAQDLTFQTTGSERARIDSNGNLLVGHTSSLGTAAKAQFVQAGAGAAGAAISADATSATFSYSVAWFAANRSASSAFNFINCTSDQYIAPQFRVQGNGTILATNTTIQSISDARTKENIRDSEEGLQVILGLQPRRFDFKQGFGNGRKNVLGFVAQEIETVFPDAVSEAHLDPDKKDIAYKTVGPGELIPVLVKAIQEQQAMIAQLQADIASLKGTA